MGSGSKFDKWVGKTEQGSQVCVYGSRRYRSALSGAIKTAITDRRGQYTTANNEFRDLSVGWECGISGFSQWVTK